MNRLLVCRIFLFLNIVLLFVNLLIPFVTGNFMQLNVALLNVFLCFLFLKLIQTENEIKNRKE